MTWLTGTWLTKTSLQRDLGSASWLQGGASMLALSWAWRASSPGGFCASPRVWRVKLFKGKQLEHWEAAREKAADTNIPLQLVLLA